MIYIQFLRGFYRNTQKKFISNVLIFFPNLKTFETIFFLFYIIYNNENKKIYFIFFPLHII